MSVTQLAQVNVARMRAGLDSVQMHDFVAAVPDGARPTVDEALRRLELLRRYGPTPRAFSLRRRFGPDGAPVTAPGAAHRIPSSFPEPPSGRGL